MRTFSTPIGLYLLGLLLAGCASNAAPRQDFAQRWVGQKFDSFIVTHGPPQVNQRLGDGRTVAEWTDVFNTPNMNSPVQTLIGAAGNVPTIGGAYQLTCKLRFVVGRGGVIEQASVVTDTYGLRGTSRCSEVFAR